MQKNEGAVFPQKAGRLKEREDRGRRSQEMEFACLCIPCRLPSVSQLPSLNPSQPAEALPFPKATHIASRPIQTRQHAKTHSAVLRLRGPGLREICTAGARCDSETGSLVAGQTSARLPNSDAHMARRSQCDIHSVWRWNAWTGRPLHRHRHLPRKPWSSKPRVAI
jgi:hypothetical protein